MEKSDNVSHRWAPVIVLLLVAAIGWAIYSPSVTAEFQFDDRVVIVKNDAIRFVDDVPLFVRSFKLNIIPGLTYAANYAVGQFNAAGYHIVNILLHMLTAFLLFFFVKGICATPVVREGSLSRHSVSIAAGSAILFLVHPVNSHAVISMSQRATLVRACLILLTIILYSASRVSHRRVMFWLTVIATAATLISKETALVLPVLIVLYEFFFFSSDNKKIYERIYLVAPFFLLAGVIVWMLFYQPTRELLGITRVFHVSGEAGQNILTALAAVAVYMRLLVAPVQLNIDYDFPVVSSLNESGALLGLGAVVVCVAAAAVLFRRSRVLSFCIVWFLVTLFSETLKSIFAGHDFVLEYYLYLPLAGVVMLVPTMVVYATKKSKIAVIVTVIIASICAPMTYKRNAVWKDTITLWTDVIKKSPQKARCFNNLGIAYSEAGENQMAVDYFSEAIRRDNTNPVYFVNIGSSYGQLGDFEKAIQFNLKALALNASLPKAYSNLGYIYSQQGLTFAAIDYYRKAVRLDPYNAQIFVNLSSLYSLKGDIDRVILFSMRALQLDPTVPQAYNNLGLAYGRINEHDKAIFCFKKTLELDPRLTQVYENLGIAYTKKGDYDSALGNLKTALSFDPNSVKAHLLLGIAYGHKGDIENVLSEIDELRRLNSAGLANSLEAMLRTNSWD